MIHSITELPGKIADTWRENTILRGEALCCNNKSQVNIIVLCNKEMSSIRVTVLISERMSNSWAYDVKHLMSFEEEAKQNMYDDIVEKTRQFLENTEGMRISAMRLKLVKGDEAPFKIQKF